MFVLAKDEYIEPRFKSSSEIEEDKDNRELLDELTATDFPKLKKYKLNG